MGRSGVFDIDGIDCVFAVSNLSQAPRSSPVEQSRNQMVIARTPNQMRPERAGEQMMLAVGLQDHLLGKGLGKGLISEPARWVRLGFINAALIAAGERDAGA